MKPYRYVRSRWWGEIDLKEIAKEFKSTFSVEETLPRWGSREMLPNWGIDYSFRLKVKADTLTARLSPVTAVLFQREGHPFTERDLALRNRIFTLYPHRSYFRKEPKFQIAARQLAVDAIDAADARGGDPATIADADAYLAEGDALRAAEAFKDVVAKYKDAVATAESA